MMRDQADQIIYVGKARNLRNRVRQYFQSSKNQYQKVRSMVQHVRDFEYIIVRNELESLILESNLIKEYHPKYNILLRDDKQYPYIKVTLQEPYPRVLKTRKILKDGAKYFGPYPNVLAVNQAIEVIHDIYPLKTCKLDLTKSKGRVRPCLNYFIGRCMAPCLKSVSQEDYGVMIKEILDFLEGRNQELMDRLKLDMKKAADDLKFEAAGRIRDQIQALSALQEKQIITQAASQEEYDIIHFARGEGDLCLQIFFYRQGKILGREHFIMKDPYRDQAEEILRSFILQFYHGLAYIPKTLLLPEALEDQETIEAWLSEKAGHKVAIQVPKIGEKRRLLQLVHKNALEMLTKHSQQYNKKQEKRDQALEDLKNILGLEEKPHRIEAYDISNISGVESVGSMVVFEEGKAKKSDYRRFRIKTVVGADDYGSLREVLSRRFLRGMSEKEEAKSLTSFSYFPDLIMMDGGKGQVNMALSLLEELGIYIPVCGLVKDDKHQTRGIIYKNQEFNLDKDSYLHRLIYQVQEEAHRFAINYHRSLRSQSLFRSELDDIPKIGPKRKKALMSHFKSLGKIKKASIEELLEVEGMNKPAALSLYGHFHGGKDD